MNRKEFLAALAATVAVPGLVLSSSGPTHVGATDVARYRENLLRLYALDDHYGASDEIYSLTVRSVRQLVHVLNTASFTPEVGDQLRSVTGEAMEHAGWLAFDAARHHDARYWWLEALHLARMAGDADVEVVVLCSMSSAAAREGRGRDVVDLAQAAARNARRGRSTPRLRSLLAAREARGHAHLGDASATRRALATASVELERGRHDDDPAWLEFWGHNDLACLTSLAAFRLGDLAWAEQSARVALATVDSARYPRNHALYQAYLAAVLTSARKLDEAVPVAANAAMQAIRVSSERLTSDVHKVVRALRAHDKGSPSVRELAEWVRVNLSAPRSWQAAT